MKSLIYSVGLWTVTAIFFQETSFAVNPTDSTYAALSSSSRVCSALLLDQKPIKVVAGDLIRISIDAQHILEDNMVTGFDLPRLLDPTNDTILNLTTTGTASVLGSYSWFDDAERPSLHYEYILLAHTKGELNFATTRNYLVSGPPREMSREEIWFLSLLTQFRIELLKNGSGNRSLEAFLLASTPNQSPQVAAMYSRMSADEEKLPFQERLEKAEERIELFRTRLMQPDLGFFPVSGNRHQIQVTQRVRSGVRTNKVHFLYADSLPDRLDAEVGDIVVVQTRRCQALVDCPSSQFGAAFRWDIPEVQGVGLRQFAWRATQRQRTFGQIHTDEALTFFMVEPCNSAALQLFHPKQDFPKPSHPQRYLERQIPVYVHLAEGETAPTALTPQNVPLPILRSLASISPDTRFPDSPLGISEISAISTYYQTVLAGKRPTVEMLQNLEKMLSVYFGKTQNERIGFLKAAGLTYEDQLRVFKLVDFQSQTSVFMSHVMAALGMNAGVARICFHLIQQQL